MSRTPAIITHDLTKTYPGITAVDSLNLRVQPGEIYGFLGLNGAGKTTTIRALLGMIKPSSGRISVLGETLGKYGRGPWSRVGHLVEAPAAYPELTVYENLLISARLHRVNNLDIIDQAIDAMGIRRYAQQRARVLSTGNFQRLGLARALLHDPELLLLDEPTNGLDPAGVVEIRDLLKQLAHERGKTILMSSHILSEVDRLADRIGIIHEGKLVEEYAAETLEALRSQYLCIQVKQRGAALESLEKMGFIATIHGSELRLTEQQALDNPGKIAELLVKSGNPPEKLVIEHEDLEQHFLRLTGAQS